MTREDAAKIVAMLFASYPNLRFTRDNVDAYIGGIIDLDATAAGMAAERLRKNAKFPPAISEIRDACASMVHGPRKTGAEAYAELLAAVQRHGATPVVRFDANGQPQQQKPWPPIAPDIEAAMRRTWGTWSDCCHAPDAQEVADRARFIQAYDGMSERDRADLVSGVPLPAAQTAAPRLASPATKPPEPGEPKTLPRPVQAQAIAVPKQNTPTPVPIVAPRQPSGPTPFQGRRLSAEEIEAELKKRSAK